MVPYVNTFGGEEGCVGGSGEEPEEFFGDAAPEDAFGGEKRELVVTEGESHLSAEEGEGAGAGAVGSVSAVGKNGGDEF